MTRARPDVPEPVVPDPTVVPEPLVVPDRRASEVRLVTWDDHRPSGGNTYNRELVAALRAAGVGVDVVELAGSWPEPARRDVARLSRVLAAHPRTLVDGIVASGAPDAVRTAVRAGTRVVVLVHMASPDEHGLDEEVRAVREATEREALRAASAVVAPSRAAAADLTARYGLDGVHVVAPGGRRAAVAPGSGNGSGSGDGAPAILCLANLTPTKDQLTVVAALAELVDLPWSARLVGSAEVDPAYARRVRAAVDGAGLTDRVLLPGARTGPALEQVWERTDLLVLVSRTETFGLVVAEALARGIPAVVGAGTGAVEALVGADPAAEAPGAVIPTGDAAALSRVLRTWLTDAGVRTRWRRAALSRRGELPGWDAAAAAVRAVLLDQRRASC